MSPPELLTLDEAAGRLGVHYMTAYRYVRTGVLPATKVGRTWQVTAADVDALEAQRADPDGGGDPGARRPPSNVGRAGYARRLEARLLVADEAGAWTLVDAALAAGLTPAEILVDVVAPALALVGEGWHAGEVSIVAEHQATATANRVIGRLGPRFAVRGQPRGQIVVGSAPGDHHGLPSALLRDLLRGRNFAVTDLGADVPAESWAEAVSAAADEGPPLVAVGIGATTAGNDRAVSAAVAAIRAAADVPILVGGLGIRDADHGRALGADLRSSSLADAVELFDALAPRNRSTAG